MDRNLLEMENFEGGGMTMRKHAILGTALAAVLTGGTAQAVVFDLYNDVNPAMYTGTGEELADALITPGTGVYYIPGSAAFVGNFDGSPSWSGGIFFDGDLPPDGLDGEVPPDGYDGEFPPGPSEYGSAAFYYGLSLDPDGILSLPDGVLLTSGYADPPTTNTDSGFTGLASGLGDAGLDTLIAAAGFPDVTMDSTVLTFDFVVDPGVNAVSLDFMFGSDEYPEYADSFPDIGAIFIDGVNYAGFADGSLLNVRSGTIAAGNFLDNESGTYPIEYDGISMPLTAVGLLDPNLAVHNIKIAVSDTNDQILDSAIFVANMQGLFVPGADPNDPILPIDGDDPNDGFDFIIDVGDTGVGIDPTQPIFIDPVVSVGYIYESAGPAFATILLPDLPEGDDLYSVYGWNGSSFDFLGVASAGITFDLLAFNPGGYNKIKVGDIEPQNLLDPSDPVAFVTGLTFVGGGSGFGLKMIPLTQNYNPVPTPMTPALLLLGLGGLMWVRRRA